MKAHHCTERHNYTARATPQPLTQSDHRKFSHCRLQCVQVACVHVCGQADVYTRGSFYLLDGRAKITLKLHNITDAKKALALRAALSQKLLFLKCHCELTCQSVGTTVFCRFL